MVPFIQQTISHMDFSFNIGLLYLPISLAYQHSYDCCSGDVTCYDYG